MRALLPAIDNQPDLRCRNDGPYAGQVLLDTLEVLLFYAPPVFIPADAIVQEFHTRLKPFQVLIARCADQRCRLLFGHVGNPLSGYVVVVLAWMLAKSVPAACSFV